MSTEASTSSNTASNTRRNPGDEVLLHLRNQTVSYYLGDVGLDQKCEFFVGGMAGNSLVVKGDNETPLKFILSGVFEIDRRDFYFTPDASFDPANNFGATLEKAKASCWLLPVKRNPLYDFSKTHFPTYIANLNNLENKAPAPPQAERQSCIVQTNEGTSAIKLTHALFEVSLVRGIYKLTDHNTQALKTDEHEDASTGKSQSPFLILRTTNL
jgi:hypothetical protein